MAGGTDNIPLKLAAKTWWRLRQQLVDDDKDDNNDDNDNDNKDDEQDDKDSEHDEHDDNKHNDKDHNNDNDVDKDNDNDDDNKANAATAVGSDDNGGNKDGWGHRQQSTKIGSKDTVAVATAIC